MATPRATRPARKQAATKKASAARRQAATKKAAAARKQPATKKAAAARKQPATKKPAGAARTQAVTKKAGAARKQVTKKAGAARKPAAKPAPGGAAARIVAALDRLRAWGAAGKGTITLTAPGNDAKARLKAPAPEWGKVTWALPPSYVAFLSHASRLAITWGENIGHDEFVVLDPDEMAETGAIVYMPDDVSRDDGVYLSTNHLVPFASAGNDECAFCFDVAQPTAAGEYPVYFHHQDEPRARLKKGGAWEDPDSATPDFADFTAWLEWVAGELSAGREPENAYPSAFYNMPGRAKAQSAR